MPTDVTAVTDSENEAELLAVTKGRAKNTAASEDGEGAKDNEEGDDDESEPEEEYEIEEILKAERGRFAGRYGYFVKWKGYGSDENSWVDERDAGNAEDVINAYWKKEKEKEKAKAASKGRKSMSTGPRGSSATASVPPGKSVKTAKPKRKVEDSDVEMIDNDEDDEPAKKKSRKSNGTSASAPAPKKQNRSMSEELGGGEEEPEQEQEMDITKIPRYMRMPSWERLVVSVDTVERGEPHGLVVFFTFPKTKRFRATSNVCAEKFPQKLIAFYEGNLRWKSASPEPEDMKE